MAPYPLSIFDETGMRKTKKSVFYDLFSPVSNPPNLAGSAIAIDGGFLLHRVVWQSKEIFSTILSKYVDYVKQYYNPATTTIVFDGYPDEASLKSTKSAERLRRKSKHSSANVVFTETMTATMPKEQFLSNDNNKERLISMLREKLVQQGFEVRQAVEDADTLIVNTAIQVAENFATVIIIGEDTDLLILLTAKAPNSSNIYVMNPGKGTSQNTFYSPRYFNFSSAVKQNLLFLHAISGCDTTSAFYRQGKLKFVQLLEKNTALQEAVKIFHHADADPEDLISAGQLFLAALYSPKADETSLDKIRHEIFSKSIIKPTFNLASLPPTNAAAAQHILRVYLQIQGWYDRPKDPLSWGWRRTDLGLLPTMNTKDPAPAEILNTVFCGCTKGCTGKCSCRKVDMKCSTICLNCHAQSCSNSAPFEDEGVSHMPIAVEAEIREDSPFQDDTDEEGLDMTPQLESFVDEGPSTSKKMRT